MDCQSLSCFHCWNLRTQVLRDSNKPSEMQNICFQDKIEWWVLDLMEQVQIRAFMPTRNPLLNIIFYFHGVYCISLSLLYMMLLMVPIWRNWHKHNWNLNIIFLRWQPLRGFYSSDLICSQPFTKRLLPVIKLMTQLMFQRR